MRGYWDYFNLALHWLCLTAPHLLRRVAAGMDRGGRFYQSEWPLRQGTRGRWRGLYAVVDQSNEIHYILPEKFNHFFEIEVHTKKTTLLLRVIIQKEYIFVSHKTFL